MPLDGHSYLVAQGWSGKGSGLRHGAISRPLAIPQKRTLAGLGKDRDDAFPFWEHVFSVAAKTIQVKIHNVEDDNNSGTDAESTPPLPILTRTSTGLLSNKRPLIGTPASSGTSTPSTESSSNGYRMSIVASAKREAARKGLYSRFFRGPVLGPDDTDEKIASSSTSSAAVQNTTASTSVAAIVEDSDIELSYGEQRKGQEKKRKAEKEKKKSERRSEKEKKKSERRSDEKNEERKRKEKKKRETGKEKEDSTYPDPAGEVTSERKRKRSSSKDEKESEKKKSKKQKQKQKAKGKAEEVDDSGTITTDDLEDEGGERESLNKKSREKKQQVQDEDGDERRTHDGSSSPSRVRRISKGRKRR